jgi:DNA-binding transcriptional LysR family regulator
MDLRQLRCFVAVAEERSVTRAAIRLHLTQPPLSAQLSRMERELGVQLLVRHRRGVDLTQAGQRLLEHARQVLSDMDAAVDAVRGVGQGRTGRLALAFVPSAAWTWLPPLLRRFCSEMPEVRLDLADAGPDEVVDLLWTRRVDLGALYLPPGGPDRGADADLDVAVVRRDPLVAVLPRALADEVGERVDLAALADQTFLAPARAARPGLHAHLLNACRGAGFEPARLREVGLAQTAVSLVAAGLGVSVLPATVQPACTGGAVAVPLRQHAPAVETALLWRRAEPPSPVTSHFLRLALSTPEPDVLGPRFARRRSTPAGPDD